MRKPEESWASAVKALRPEWIALAALALVWAGIWGAWIPHKTASLTQNAIYLADWSDVLPQVYAGPLAGVPNVLRLAVGLAVAALAVALGLVRHVGARWGLRALASLPGLVLLPPYPHVLALWRSETYSLRFVVAMVLWVGVAASALTDLLPFKARCGLIGALSIGAAGLGVWAFFTLRRPFEEHYAHAIPPGWGMAAFVIGLMVAALLQAAAMRRA